ncbi:hypothetical protein AXK58_21355 [Tsukamurella tyrosinosolvens]|nr:hypothetical protein AXK58_21355 [Tsukamurella tyrosinosolvens]
MPPATTPHAVELGVPTAWPTFSETGVGASVIDLFEKASVAFGTGDGAATLQAVAQAYTTGVTPTALIQDFTTEQRTAFDNALMAINRGQGASVSAQDILNTKVKINGIATSFEAAVEQLVAQYAGSGGPESPQNQAEFQQKYMELLQQAQSEISKTGSDHKTTQEALMTGISKGTTPEVPSTMTPTQPGNPQVPGMPDSLGKELQSVAGQMIKPQNLQMPNFQQLAQPVTQSAQAALSELMKKTGDKSGKDGGLPITQDALQRLTTGAGLTGQGASLSDPRPGREGDKGADGAGRGGPGRVPGSGLPGRDEGSGRTAPPPGTPPPAQDKIEGAGDGAARPGSPVTADNPVARPGGGDPGGSNSTVPSATEHPTTPATSSPPPAASVTTSLSAGDAQTGPGALTTHTSAGDGAGAGTSTLAQSGAGAGAPAAPMAATPMMAPPPMMGGAGAGAPGASGRQAGGGVLQYVPFTPDLASEEDKRDLADYGADRRGLDGATSKQHAAAAYAAGILRAHRRVGVNTRVAVGLQDGKAVFCTSDGLGFLFPGVRASSKLVPLATRVPTSFAQRWLGCAQPWRPLIDAVELGFIGELDAIVSTDPTAEAVGITVIDAASIDEINPFPASEHRVILDAVEADDADPVLALLVRQWGRPDESAVSLMRRLEDVQWQGDLRPENAEYLQVWAHYLLAAAAVDLQHDDLDDATYALRSALRVPAAPVVIS